MCLRKHLLHLCSTPGQGIVKGTGTGPVKKITMYLYIEITTKIRDLGDQLKTFPLHSYVRTKTRKEHAVFFYCKAFIMVLVAMFPRIKVDYANIFNFSFVKEEKNRFL